MIEEISYQPLLFAPPWENMPEGIDTSNEWWEPTAVRSPMLILY